MYNGTGISNNFFDPLIAGPGFNFIEYTYTDSNGCTSSVLDTLTVYALPIVNLGSASFCENDSFAFLVNGFPNGGEYFGTGISNGIIDVSMLSLGNNIYYYELIDSNNCSSTDSSTIFVNSPPIVQLSLPLSICENDSLLNLNGGTPVGGMYSGLGVLKRF